MNDPSWGWGGTWRRAFVVLAVLVGMLAVPVGRSQPSDRADAAAAQSDPDQPGRSDVLPPDGHWTVTLLTGEVVDVASDAEGRVRATPRNSGGPVQTVRDRDGDVHVIPREAVALYGRVLDPELFNVTGLVRQGYDDARSPVVPLIVRGEPAISAVEGSRARGAAPTQPLTSIDGLAVEVPKADTAAAGELLDVLDELPPGTERSGSDAPYVWLDRRVTADAVPGTAAGSAPDGVAVPGRPARPGRPGRPAQPVELDRNLTQVGADDAWAAGLTGEGVRVAVLDSGIDATHPDLAGQVVAQENFSVSPDMVDRFGHGTHVASLVAGSGAAAGGARSGVAPDADLVVAKVLDDTGSGSLSDIITAAEWATGPAGTEIVNMSLGADALGADGTDPLSLAVNRLTEERGALFVVSAGNFGYGWPDTIGIPGVADRALTVGAVDGDGVLADFSSLGPVQGYELKPEMVAPGVEIAAARAAGTAMGTPIDDLYTRASGTSMATPHVAGAAAILAQQHPGWTGDAIRNALIGSTTPIDGDPYAVGAGRLDLGAAITADLHADRDVIEASLPHPRTEPHDETLGWTNDSDQPVTIDLSAELRDADGEGAVVEGGVSVTPSQVTIQPGEAASATVSLNGPDLEPGVYTGIVEASSDGQPTLRTPIAIEARQHEVDLTIAATAPGGTGARPEGYVNVLDLDDISGFSEITGFVGDTFTMRVPPGRYAVVGFVMTGDYFSFVNAMVGDPEVVVDGDTTVAFDGASAVPLRPTVEGVPTEPTFHSAAFAVRSVDNPYGWFSFTWSMPYPLPPVHVVPMEGPAETFATWQSHRLEAADLLTARIGRREIEVIGAESAPVPPLGRRTLPVVDTGDGSDMSGAGGALALVQVPAEASGATFVDISRRAAAAGVAVVGLVDEQRSPLTLTDFRIVLGWDSDVPVIGADGADAAALRAAAAAGDDVTVEVASSPFVYDLIEPATNRVTTEPLVVDRSEQRDLATIRERIHRDAGGDQPRSSREAIEPDTWTWTADHTSYVPPPPSRTAYVTPDVLWETGMRGIYVDPDGFEVNAPLAQNLAEAYAPGSSQTRTWLRRPVRPGPANGFTDQAAGCRPPPAQRLGDEMFVGIVPFQDGPDRHGCGEASDSTITLEREGEVIVSGPGSQVFEEVPSEAGAYRLSYQQEGDALYPFRDATTWTFGSAHVAGEDPVLLPLLVVDYRLPLDGLNRPTGRGATFTVDQVAGAADSEIEGLQVWTSTDDGATWQDAQVRCHRPGTYKVTLPRITPGTSVSLRVDAHDAAGNRIEQTIYDAYHSPPAND